jgi:hypothetical protein
MRTLCCFLLVSLAACQAPISETAADDDPSRDALMGFLKGGIPYTMNLKGAQDLDVDQELHAEAANVSIESKLLSVSDKEVVLDAWVAAIHPRVDRLNLQVDKTNGGALADTDAMIHIAYAECPDPHHIDVDGCKGATLKYAPTPGGTNVGDPYPATDLYDKVDVLRTAGGLVLTYRGYASQSAPTVVSGTNLLLYIYGTPTYLAADLSDANRTFHGRAGGVQP